MTRLGAASKGEHFPTPTAILPLLANLVDAQAGGVLLDPCAGTGDAAATLAALLGCQAIGNELDSERAAKAARKLAACTVGSYETLRVEGSASISLINPPYGDVAGRRGKRYEVEAMRSTLAPIASGGAAIVLVPLATALSSAFLRVFCAACELVSISRFPDPHFAPFSQVVVLGRKRAVPATLSSADAADFLAPLRIDPAAVLRNSMLLPVLGGADLPKISVPACELPTLVNVGDDPAELVALATARGASTTSRFRELTTGTADGKTRIAAFRPVLPLRDGHAAQLLASGFLDGAEVTWNGERFLVRGSARRVTRTTDTIDETSGRLVRVSQQRVVTVLTLLHRETGAIDTLDPDRTPDRYRSFLLDQAQALAATVQARFPALAQHDTPSDDDELEETLAACHAPQTLPGVPEGLLPKQVDAIRGAGLLLRGGARSAIVIGEMGTGKSAIAAAIWAVSEGRAMRSAAPKLVADVPGHLSKKWVREISAVTRAFGVEAVIARNEGDVDRAFASSRPTALIFSRERAKMGMAWRHAGICTYIREEGSDGATITSNVVRCPDCGIIQYVQVEDDFVRVSWRMEKGRRVVAVKGDKRLKCHACASPLYQCMPLKMGRVEEDGLAYGGGKLPLARYIARRYAHRYTYIADEVHEQKAADSDRGYAMGQLASAALRTIALTGTIYGGRTISAFHLLYRLVPSFRRQFAYGDSAAFIKAFGLTKETTVLERDAADLRSRTSTYGYTRQTSRRTEELPSALPELVAQFLPYSVWLRLSDFGLALPAYREAHYVAELPAGAAPALNALSHFRDEAVKEARRGNSTALARWAWAALGFPYAMDQDDELESPAGAHAHLRSVPMPPQGFPLDEAFVRYAVNERDHGRRVLVYMCQMKRRDAAPRLAQLLEVAGLRVSVLRSTVDREEREAWVSARVAEGVDVLIAAASLLETGLDLVAFPTISYFGVEASTYRTRQSIRRSYRLGATQDVCVSWWVYHGSAAHRALVPLSKQLEAAAHVDGRLAEGLAALAVGADDEQGGDLIAALMSQVMRGVTDDLSESFPLLVVPMGTTALRVAKTSARVA
jgi:hypothetical protein